MAFLARLKRQAGLLALLLGGMSLPLGAVTVDGLYTVMVPVASSAPDDLKQGYQEGLKQVLARVSGQGDLVEQGNLEELLARAESLVQSYQFLRAAEDGQANQLRMTFGAVGVNQALASIDVPVWGANRPLTLAWIAVEEPGGRKLLVRPEVSDQTTSGGDDTWRQAFEQAAIDRGLPMVLPPAEKARDGRLLSEVWGQFMGSINDASGAIDHNLLAVVKVNRTGGVWQAAWRLEGEGIETSEQAVTGDTPAAVARQVIGAWADRLAARYAVSAGDISDSARVDIVVEPVDSITDYAQVIAALEKMTPVLAVSPVRASAERMTLKVSFSGELSQLRQYIALDPRFAEWGGPVESTSSGRPAGDQSGAAIPLAVTPPPSGADEGVLLPQAAGDADGLDQLFQYRPLELAAEEQEQAFESLYQTLRYRWRGGPVIESADPGS